MLSSVFFSKVYPQIPTVRFGTPMVHVPWAGWRTMSGAPGPLFW